MSGSFDGKVLQALRVNSYYKLSVEQIAKELNKSVEDVKAIEANTAYGRTLIDVNLVYRWHEACGISFVRELKKVVTGVYTWIKNRGKK